ncbi:MAG: hypothetical protein QME51_10640 [Planctomycetota bacterium]|nr:hypothetical protein [Planctomycetota bacterium]
MDYNERADYIRRHQDVSHDDKVCPDCGERFEGNVFIFGEICWDCARKKMETEEEMA